MAEPLEVSVRDLRNHVSALLRRVEAGETLRVSVDRRPVADIVPLPARRNSISTSEFLAWRNATGGADPGLADDLRALLTETTDDVDV